MSDVTPRVIPPVEIGPESRPPTVVTPDPSLLFARRFRRFHDLAADHRLGAYLRFLRDLTQIQHLIVADLPSPSIPPDEAIQRSIGFGMPVLTRAPFRADDAVNDAIHRLLDHAASIAMPDPARAALQWLRQATEADITACIEAVLADAIPTEAIAEHVFIGAALQVHFACAAARLDATRLRYIGDGICPVCGAPPVSSGIVGWSGSERTRFCTCSLCATRWNAVRVKCLACSSTKGIHYQAIDGLPATIKAECCDACRSYVKLMAEDEDPSLEPIADDVASMGLDLLVKEAGYRRAGVNLYLIGT